MNRIWFPNKKFSGKVALDESFPKKDILSFAKVCKFIHVLVLLNLAQKTVIHIFFLKYTFMIFNEFSKNEKCLSISFHYAEKFLHK